MPSDKEDIKQENKSQVQTDEAITIIIGKDISSTTSRVNPLKPNLKKPPTAKTA